ncbi:MAG: DUF3226 domain-containing protein [Bacteroidota bacterium]
MKAAKKNLYKRLLVEGKNDEHVVYALCNSFGLPQNFEVVDCDGIDGIWLQLSIAEKSDISAMGIIVDTDLSLQSRWQSVRDKLQKNLSDFKPALPDNDSFPAYGLITEAYTYDRDQPDKSTIQKKKKIGVWIMPDNSQRGILEDFIAMLIPENDLLMPAVSAHINQVEEAGLNKYSLTHQSKARIHAWLALQESPGTPLGQSITKGYLNPNSEICLRFTNWLKELFEDS